MKNIEIMINLDHPCRKVDVWEVNSKVDFIIAISQGYLPLRVIKRAIMRAFPNLEEETREFLDEMKEHDTVLNE